MSTSTSVSERFQKALTRLRGNRRNPVVKLLDCEATESNEQDHFQELPPELLERILSFLSQDSCLYSCRLVNRQWNNFASELLQQLHNQKWNGWEPISHYASEPPFAPSLLQNNTILKNQGFSHLRLPPALKRYKQIEVNPFNAKSLRIYYNHVRSRSTKKAFVNSSTKWDKFFTKLGHFLTSLILDSVQLSLSQLSLMLSQIVNLKALTLRYVTVCDVPTNQPSRVPEKLNKKVTIFPPLQTLQILGHNNEKIVNWLLDNLAQRLQTLKMELGGYRPGLLSDSTRNFENLQQLKITYPRPHPPTEKIWEPEIHPKNLQRISVFIPIHSEDVEWLYEFQCSGAVKFLCQFASGLVHLRLSMEFKKLVGHLKKEKVIFSKLRTLCLASNEYENEPEETWQDILLKENAAILVPSLESVKFCEVLYYVF